MDVLSNLGGYFTKFDTPLNVSVISKLSKWKNLQSLNHDAMLSNLKNNFHGVKDAKIQFATHTAANPIQLSGPYAGIQGLILLNQETAKMLTSDAVLGPVGPAVGQIGNLGAVFSVPSTALLGNKKSVQAIVA